MNTMDAGWWPVLWDSGVVAMAVLGPTRTYSAVNPAFCRLLESDAATIIAWTYERIGHPGDLDVELDAFVRLAEGASVTAYARRFRTARGGEFTAEVRLCAGPGDQILQVILPNPGAQSAETARAAGAELLTRRLADLGSALSHDALEPVRQVGVQAGLLAERSVGFLAEREQKTLATIERLARKAGRQLRGLAIFARLGQPVIDPVPLPLRALIDAAWSAQPAIPADATFCVEMADNLGWSCDREQVTSALRELLTNAITFRDPSRALSVRLTVTVSNADGHCTISVIDNGRGIARIDQPRLFRLFAAIGSDAGAGLGLALVRAVAEGHGGQATLVSDPGQGVQVSFTLSS